MVSSSSKSYAPYYEAVNQAELRIVELDFEGAFGIYSQVFPLYEKHRISDLHNASLCAILIGKYDYAKQWMKEQVSFGIPIDEFKGSIYRKLPDSCWRELEQEYDSLRSIYYSNTNVEFKRILDGLRGPEQQYMKLSKNLYDSLIYEHAKVLHRTILEKGIPKVPMFEGQLLPVDIMRHHFALRNQLKHFEQFSIDTSSNPYRNMNFSDYDLESILIKAVFNGDISPQFIAMCMEHSELDYTKAIDVFYIIIDLEKKTIKKVINKNIDTIQVNSYRKYLGLESLEDALRKNFEIALYYSQGLFPFDEHIKRYREVGYTESEMTRLGLYSDEFDRRAISGNQISREIKTEYLNKWKELNDTRDNSPLCIQNPLILLTEFKISQTSVKKTLIPPLK
ncbi:hypothetical protein CYCD_30510 [Tenuifilaceae bacterium CYCD]|nr:hypothetical protein CYCD_30510 [Tenuifilaceae bacterium CYCD]